MKEPLNVVDLLMTFLKWKLLSLNVVDLLMKLVLMNQDQA